MEFRDFLKVALDKNPETRPSAAQLLEVSAPLFWGPPTALLLVLCRWMSTCVTWVLAAFLTWCSHLPGSWVSLMPRSWGMCNRVMWITWA